MPAYGKIKVDTITYDLSGTATDVPVSTIAVDSDLALKADLSGATFTGQINGTSLVLNNDLTVNGTLTYLNSTDLEITDKNIIIGKVSTPSDATADLGGITLKGATDKEIKWVNATDAWTFSEHIELASGKTFIGDGSTITALNGSNIATGTVADARISALTASKLTGALPAISGANLTNLPPAGNTFTAVANGSIANNKAVKLDTDGKVSEIKTSLASASLSVPAAQSIESTNAEHYSGANTGDPKLAASVYDPNSNKVLHLWNGPSSRIHYKIGTINTSTGGITWQGVNTGSHNFSLLADSTSLTGSIVAACWHPTRSRVVCVANTSSSKASLYFADISSANGTTTPTWSGPHTISTNNIGTRMYIQHDPDADRLIFSYASSDNNAYIKVIDVASDLSITQGTEVQVNNSGSGEDYYGQEPSICYDTNRDKWSIIYKDAGTRDLRGKVGTVTASSNSISLSSQVSLDTGENFAIVQVFDPNTNKICIVHRTSGTFYARLGEISSSGTLSVGTKVTMSGQSGSSDVGESDYGPGRVAMVYLPYSSKVVGIVPVSDGGISDNPKYVEWTTTGSTPSIAQINAPYTVLEQRRTKWPWVGVAINTGMVCWTIGLRGSSSSGGDNKPRQYTTSVVGITTNLTDAEAYVGFADQAYTNGQTATISTYGNNVNTLSGMTIGSQYYVQGDGSIATTVDSSLGLGSNRPLAGMALTATKLLIRDPLAKA